jgi:hypothetical protein
LVIPIYRLSAVVLKYYVSKRALCIKYVVEKKYVIVYFYDGDWLFSASSR